MKAAVLAVNLFFVFWIGPSNVLMAQGPPVEDEFRRGDANGDGVVQMSDWNFIRIYLHYGGDPPACMDAADADDDGDIDDNDGFYILNYLFGANEPPPPDPGPDDCGDDPTADLLDCDSYEC
jgi:hypothetical protein